jgi:hypothetical protein
MTSTPHCDKRQKAVRPWQDPWPGGKEKPWTGRAFPIAWFFRYCWRNPHSHGTLAAVFERFFIDSGELTVAK